MGSLRVDRIVLVRLLGDELVRLRDEKLFRFIGLTTHVAFETVYKMIATGGFDQVLLAYGYFNKGMDTLLSQRNLEFREKCLAKAHDLRMAIVAILTGDLTFTEDDRRLLADFSSRAYKSPLIERMRIVERGSRARVPLC